jgi:hypothetical protein
MHAAARRWAMLAVDAGLLTADVLRIAPTKTRAFFLALEQPCPLPGTGEAAKSLYGPPCGAGGNRPIRRPVAGPGT